MQKRRSTRGAAGSPSKFKKRLRSDGNRRASGLRGACAVETLELRRMLAANPLINEFMAKNTATIKDGNNAYSDWIEIRNNGDTAVNLAGYHLTDDSTKPAKWTFPSVNLPAGGYLLVFADSSGAVDPSGYLHTNFSLNNDGEAMQMTDPANAVISSFGTNAAPFPALAADVSYGSATVGKTLVGTGSPVRVTIPKNTALDAGQWKTTGFDDSTWTAGTNGVGFDTQAPETTSPATPTLTGNWVADSLNGLANNATVSTWTSSVGNIPATRNSAGAPKLVKSALNGHSVVKFDPTDGTSDLMRVTAGNNPMSGKTDFSVAVVFQTSVAGVGNADYWYNNSGIIDSEQGGVTNDWGLAINKSGRLAAGVGNPDVNLYTDPGLNNGAAHVAIFTRSGTTTTLQIDNDTPIIGTASGSARNSADMVFGAIQTSINYFNGRIAEVRTYSGALDNDARRQVTAQLSATYGLTQVSSPITALVHTNVQSTMSGQASTALVRAPFTVDTTMPITKLTLNVQYDDGFVAYLNGVEIARRNAPAGSPTYTSTATAARTASQALAIESIDVSSAISALEGSGATNVLSFRALNASISDPDLLLVPQLVATTSSTTAAFMTTPTPNAANSTGYQGIVSSVVFSKPHGNYTTAFTTDLTTTNGATLVYTTDGSAPTLSNGTQIAPDNTGVATAHVNVTGTTTLRAAAFKDGFLPAYISSATYVFVANTITQGNVAPDDVFWGSTAMDPRVTGSSQTYTMTQALTAIPTISLTLPNDDLFGSQGIYFNPQKEGADAEHESSVEYFDPNNPTDQFQVEAGLRIQGGASRNPSNPKQSFRLFFRSDYGAGELNYPLFKGQTTNASYDHLVLRAGHNYSWANDDSSIADYARDEFGRELAQKLDGHGLVGKYVQLYLNGTYWGLYNVVEDIDTTWLANNYGGSTDDYDLMEPDKAGGMEVKDGSGDTYTTLFNTLSAAMADGSVSNAEYTNLKSLVDVQSLANYMTNVIYRGDRDAPVLIDNSVDPRNFYAFRNHTTGGPWKFTVWDGEFSMDDVNIDQTERNYTNSHLNPGLLYVGLRTNADFAQLMTDTVNRAFNDNGPLQVAGSVNNPRALYDSITSKIDAAIEGESARWGDAKQSSPFTRLDWLNELNAQYVYLANRSATVLNQFKNDFAALNVLPATTRINGTANSGGTITAGSLLTILDTNSTAASDVIYYTLDGTDPRASGGGASANALVYSSAITLNTSRTLNIRVLQNGVWSPLRTAVFTVTTTSPLHVSELMYNPPAPAAGSGFVADDFEFLELVNTGSSPLDLSSFYFTAGVTLTLSPGTTLASGARGVIVKNANAFAQRYGNGFQIIGVYPDKLSDNGEQVTLIDPANVGSPVFDFTYGARNASWFAAADGGGYSLEPINPLAPSSTLSAPGGWRASFAINGSPGVAAKWVGTSGDDRYDLRLNTTTGNVEVVLNNASAGAPATYTLLPSAADALTFDLVDGNDTVNVAAGAESIVRSLRFVGGAGNDTVQVASTAAATLSPTSVALGNSIIAIQGVETLSVGSNATVAADLSGLNLTITGGTTTINTTQHIGSLSITKGAKAVIPAGTTRSLRTGALSIDATSTLDLNDHDMIIDSADPNTKAIIGTLIRRAYALGFWTGSGIYSSAVRDASPHNKMLGTLSAAEYWAQYGAGTPYGSETLNSNSVIVKFTYAGDINFDGKVDANDYSRIDGGFVTQNNPGTIIDWFSGDLNYDGKIDANDYSMIDGGFVTQGPPLPPPPLSTTPARSGGRDLVMGGKPGIGGIIRK